jgi:hypothetical protein
LLICQAKDVRDQASASSPAGQIGDVAAVLAVVPGQGLIHNGFARGSGDSVPVRNQPHQSRHDAVIPSWQAQRLPSTPFSTTTLQVVDGAPPPAMTRRDRCATPSDSVIFVRTQCRFVETASAGALRVRQMQSCSAMASWRMCWACPPLSAYILDHSADFARLVESGDGKVPCRRCGMRTASKYMLLMLCAAGRQSPGALLVARISCRQAERLPHS